jgi:hypothetical protein
MATHREIGVRVRTTSGRVPKTCYIADVKASFGLTSREAPNRLDPNSRAYPCPDDMKPHIVAALRHFRMI